MSQDETRGLNKNLDFMRAISILSLFSFHEPEHRCRGQDTAQFPAGYRAVFPFAGEQVLQSALPFLLLHGSERTEGRGDVMKEYRLLPYSRDAALFW